MAVAAIRQSLTYLGLLTMNNNENRMLDEGGGGREKLSKTLQYPEKIQFVDEKRAFCRTRTKTDE